MLNSVLRNMRHLGKEKVQHSHIIMENDLKKLQQSSVFNTQELLAYSKLVGFMLHYTFAEEARKVNENYHQTVLLKKPMIVVENIMS